MSHHKSISENIVVKHSLFSWSRAFTLIEVLITIALSVILMLAIERLYVVYGRVIIFQKSAIDVARGGDSIMDAGGAGGVPSQPCAPPQPFFFL